jgi:hypothetical protein
MTNTHTPGSWTASIAPSTSGRGYDISRDGVRIASTPGWHPDDARASDEASNARLIAAAPELLAALRPLAAMGDASLRGAILAALRPHERDSFIAATDNARAAIAKATGGQS